jgi:hypothetical protein
LGFDQKNVLSLTSDSSNELELPTKDNIIRKLNYINSELGGGLLILGFSGHGIYKFGTPFLLTYETVNGNLLDLTDTAASISWLRRKLQTINAKQIILLLDACQNDPENAKGGADNDMSPEFKAAFEDLVIQPYQASAVLYATRPPERAYIDDEKFGFFSKAFAEGLTGLAEPSHHEPPVTLGQIVTYVQDVVPPRVRAMRNALQEPSNSISGYDLATVLADPSWIRPSPIGQQHKIHFQRVGTLNDCASLPSDSKIQITFKSRSRELYAPAGCEVSFFVEATDETDAAKVSLVNSRETTLAVPGRTFDTRDTVWSVEITNTGEAIRVSAFSLSMDLQNPGSLDFYSVASRRLNAISSKLVGRLPDSKYLSRLELVKTGMPLEGPLAQQSNYIEESNSLLLLSGSVTGSSTGNPTLHLDALLRSPHSPNLKSMDLDLDLRADNYRNLGDTASAICLFALFSDAIRTVKQKEVIQILRDEAYLALRQVATLSPELAALEAEVKGID